jgi:hypothetical protein
MTLANHNHLNTRKNDITGVLDVTFSVTEDRFGEIIDVELKPNGANIAVTEANKKEYVEAVVEYRTKTRIRDQTTALLEGFRELIPLELVNVFDERELELLIGGMSEIDTYVSGHHCSQTLRRLMWLVAGTIGYRIPTTAATTRQTRLSRGFGNASGAGRRSAKRVCCSLQRGRHACLSMGSRIFKGRMGPGDSRSRNLAILGSCLGVTRVSIGSSSLRMKITRVWRGNSYMRLSTLDPVGSARRIVCSFSTGKRKVLQWSNGLLVGL